MNVSELISLLEDMPEDAEVRLAEQPRWAFEYSVGDVVLSSDADWLEDEEEDVEAGKPKSEAKSIVYISEGSQLGYLPSQASSDLGWR